MSLDVVRLFAVIRYGFWLVVVFRNDPFQESTKFDTLCLDQPLCDAHFAQFDFRNVAGSQRNSPLLMCVFRGSWLYLDMG